MVDLKSTWAFDIETRMELGNYPNFYEKAAEFLCLVAENVMTGEVKVWTQYDDLDEMFKFLESVDYLVGHNIRGYDIRALGKLFPEQAEMLSGIQLLDTRWMCLKDDQANPGGSGLFTYAEMKAMDVELDIPETRTPNSLSSWGKRIGEHKLDIYADYTDEDWHRLELSPTLIKYCKQDVNVSVLLFKHVMKLKGIEIL